MKKYIVYKEWQLEDDDNLFFNLKSVGMWIEWFKDSYKYIFDLHFSTIEKKAKVVIIYRLKYQTN